MSIGSQINKNYVRDLQQTLYDICVAVDIKMGDIVHDNIEHELFIIFDIVHDNIEHELFIIFDEHQQTVRRKLWTHFAPKPI